MMRRILAAVGVIRVPLLGAAVLLALPIGAFAPGTSGLLRGLFDLAPLSPDGHWMASTVRTAITCFFAWLAYGLAALAVYQSAAIILDFAPERLGVATPLEGQWLEGRLAYVPVAVLCVPAVITSGIVSLDSCQRFATTMAGGLLALVPTVMLLVAVRRRMRRPPPLAERMKPTAQQLGERLDPRGYLPSGASESPGRDPFVHHAWAAFFVLVSAILWVFVATWARWPWLQGWLRIPALCSAMLLVMLSVLVFSALTFRFDFYRFPILSVLVIITAVAGLRNHTFATRAPGEQSAALLPEKVLEKRGNQSPIVVVAAAGGGIQAAGWTARVLRGLVEATPADSLDRFLKSIVVVSGVSGGSVGLAPFVAAMHEAARSGHTPTGDALLAALVSASDSSLDPVAASFATSDMIPFLPFPDRGDALEASWTRAWNAHGVQDGVTLADLASDAQAGTVPGVMFNATDMTTGERLIVGTTVPDVLEGKVPVGFVHSAHVSSSGKRDGMITVDYEPRPVVADIDLAVAARLSATFPFVTPASHCGTCSGGGAEYVVDGGYIDNYGTESLVEWLEQVLHADKNVEVDVVQIVSFPEGETVSSAPKNPLPQSQVVAPIKAVLNVRTPGQGRRGVRDVEELSERFEHRVHSYRFVYDGCDDGSAPPLSWHLTAGQKSELDKTWDGCPGGSNPRTSYDQRAGALVQHVLGQKPWDYTTILPTTSQQ
jgi:hypothetical protein